MEGRYAPLELRGSVAPLLFSLSRLFFSLCCCCKSISSSLLFLSGVLLLLFLPLLLPADLLLSVPVLAPPLPPLDCLRREGGEGESTAGCEERDVGAADLERLEPSREEEEAERLNPSMLIEVDSRIDPRGV